LDTFGSFSYSKCIPTVHSSPLFKQPLRDGRIQHVTSGPWQGLATDTIEYTARSVCRLDIVVEGYMPIHIGTGFITGKDVHGRTVIMTAAHVIEEAVRYGWPDTTGFMFMCDFERYSTSDPPEHLLPLTNEYHIHPYYDLALVYLDQEHIENINIPSTPLVLSSTAPEPLIGFTIGVLGHPSFNSSLDHFPTYFGFGEEFGIKRFSPGQIRMMEHRYWRDQDVNIILHDATTLSGNSGSCILNLNDMKVVGLHFGGWPRTARLTNVGDRGVLAQLFEANGAVPLWTLRDDPLVQALFP